MNKKMKFFAVLSGIILLIGIAWIAIGPSVSLDKIDQEKLIEQAVQRAYPGVYSSLQDLREDYPGFTPRVRALTDITSDVLYDYYTVDLPSVMVIFDDREVWQDNAACRSVMGDCDMVRPANPILGIVGTVRFGDGIAAPAINLNVKWLGLQDTNSGEVTVNRNCFAGFASSQDPFQLSVGVDGAAMPVEFKNKYGYYLVAITFENGFTHHKEIQVSKSTFESARTCDVKDLGKWPNIFDTSKAQ